MYIHSGKYVHTEFCHKLGFVLWVSRLLSIWIFLLLPLLLLLLLLLLSWIRICTSSMYNCTSSCTYMCVCFCETNFSPHICEEPQTEAEGLGGGMAVASHSSTHPVLVLPSPIPSSRKGFFCSSPLSLSSSSSSSSSSSFVFWVLLHPRQLEWRRPAAFIG
jgi:hypothetical protein